MSTTSPSSSSSTTTRPRPMHSPKRQNSLPLPGTPPVAVDLRLGRNLTLPLSLLNPFAPDVETALSDKETSPPAARYRRRSTVVSRFARFKLVQLALAASIPILALLLLLELGEHRIQAAIWTARIHAQDQWADGLGDLATWRNALSRRRRALTRRRRDGRGSDGVEERRIEEDALNAWPKWWGSSDDMKSPFDFVPSVVGSPRRVLFLTGTCY
jgi:hypothetical protein